MRREFSAGGILVRRLRGRWMVAAIRPAGKPAGIWALPKGQIGPGSRNDSGDLVPMDVAEGDEIIFSKYGGTEVKLGSDDVLILRESDVLAKVVGTREPAGAAA